MWCEFYPPDDFEHFFKKFSIDYYEYCEILYNEDDDYEGYLERCGYNYVEGDGDYEDEFIFWRDMYIDEYE